MQVLFTTVGIHTAGIAFEPGSEHISAAISGPARMVEIVKIRQEGIHKYTLTHNYRFQYSSVV